MFCYALQVGGEHQPFGRMHLLYWGWGFRASPSFMAVFITKVLDRIISVYCAFSNFKGLLRLRILWKKFHIIVHHCYSTMLRPFGEYLQISGAICCNKPPFCCNKICETSQHYMHPWRWTWNIIMSNHGGLVQIMFLSFHGWFLGSIF